MVTISNQSVRKCSKILHNESKIFVGRAEDNLPYSSDRDLTDDAIRKLLKQLKKEHPKLAEIILEQKK